MRVSARRVRVTGPLERTGFFRETGPLPQDLARLAI